MLKAWAKAMIRHASPFPLLKSNNLGAEIELSDGTIVSNKEYLSLIVSQMYEGNGLLVDTDTEVDIIEAGKNISIDFEKIITYCNKMIFRALLIPSLVADAERAGSYALGKKHFEVFLLTTNNLIKWVTEALLEQLVRPLIEVNFRNVTDFGEWPIESIDEEDMNMFATLLDKLTTNGYLTPEELDDYNAVRTKVGFAPKEKLPDAILDKIRQRQLQAQQNPQAPAQPGNNFPQKNNIPSKQGSAPAKPNAAPSKPAVEKPSNGNNIQTAQKASK
jgi:phage gp29-like protein